MTQAIERLYSIPQNSILNYDFVTECEINIIQSLLEVGNVRDVREFLSLYRGWELGLFLNEMTE